MKKKQLIGLMAAALAFVFVCGSSMLVKSFSGNVEKKANLAASTLDAIGEEVQLPSTPFVGVVKVEGTIMPNTTTSPLSAPEGYNHKKTLNLIDQMQKSDKNKGILMYINTPGGSVYETDELYLRLEKYKKETKRPVWTYMGGMACSGGYYVSMASDKIFANRNTWTGSIGVIMSMSNYKGLMDKLGVDTVLFTSGPNKSMGNPGVNMTDEQAKIFQGLVNESYEQFVGIVAHGRKMRAETVKPIADGRIYTAKQALDLKLIDGIQGYDETVEKMKSTLGKDVTFFTPKDNAFSFGSLFSMAKVNNLTDAEKLKRLLETEGSGVPMYYANTGK